MPPGLLQRSTSLFIIIEAYNLLRTRNIFTQDGNVLRFPRKQLSCKLRHFPQLCLEFYQQYLIVSENHIPSDEPLTVLESQNNTYIPSLCLWLGCQSDSGCVCVSV